MALYHIEISYTDNIVLDKNQSLHETIFKQFLKELKNKKIKLTPSEEAEWMEYLIQQIAKADELKSQIEQTDREINGMVYKLYGLSEEVIGLMENSAK